jgi:hypothetical protein
MTEKEENGIELTNNDLPVDRKAFDDVLDVLLRFADSYNWSQTAKHKKSKLYPFAFQINDNYISKFENRVIECFRKIYSENVLEVNFSGEVRFQDLTTVKFDSLKELLDKAGDKKDPEQISFKWHCYVPKPISSHAEVESIFTTEKPMNDEELGLMEFHTASMNLTVVGPTPEWVDYTFDELDPFMNSVKLGGVYKPLLIFRNKTVVDILSHGIGVLSYITYLEFGSKWKRDSKAPEELELMNKIISKPTIEEKFDEFIRQIYLPTKNSPIFETIIYFAGAIVFWIVMISVSRWLLPKLIPKSGINIGLSKNRYETYENAFKLIIFTILLSGIVIPIFRKIFGM